MLILLDIDGVMVHGASWKPVDRLNDGFASFSPRAVKSLNSILVETKAAIVLTTSHKSSYNLTQWKEIFNTRGIKANITKLDDNNSYLTRKEEILNWASKNSNIEDYVIIDDDKSLNGLPFHLKEKVVLTSSTIGLNDELAKEAIHILKDSQFV